MYKNLSNNFKKELRKKAYSLKPFVIVGQHGLTEAVIAEINVALNAHELIKIKIHSNDREERKAIMLKITESLGATPINQIGKMLVAYRKNEQDNA